MGINLVQWHLKQEKRERELQSKSGPARGVCERPLVDASIQYPSIVSSMRSPRSCDTAYRELLVSSAVGEGRGYLESASNESTFMPQSIILHALCKPETGTCTGVGNEVLSLIIISNMSGNGLEVHMM